MDMPATAIETIRSRVLDSLSNLPYGKRFGWAFSLLFSPLFWVLLFSLGRFFLESEPYQFGNDSVDYVKFDANIFHGETDIRRTPLYPYYLQMVGALVGEKIELQFPAGQDAMTQVTTQLVQGENACRWAVRGQFLFFLASIAVVYCATKRLFANPWFLAFALIGAVNYLYSWQLAILSEGLSISAVGLFLALMIWYLNRPSTGLAIGIGSCVFLMVMLRPVFLYLVILLTCFWFLRLVFPPKNQMKGRKCAMVGLATHLVVLALIFGYCTLNTRNHGQFAIAETGVLNQFFILEKTGVYQLGSDLEINEFIATSDAQAPYRFAKVQREVVEAFGQERFQEYTTSTIRENRFAFLRAALRQILEVRTAEGLNFYLIVGVVDMLLTLLLWAFWQHIPWNRLVLWGLFYGLFSLCF